MTSRRRLLTRALLNATRYDGKRTLAIRTIMNCRLMSSYVVYPGQTFHAPINRISRDVSLNNRTTSRRACVVASNLCPSTSFWSW
jgi:hypothetical protein